MPVSADNLLQKLGRGEFPAMIVLLGSDSYLREMCRKKIIEAFVPQGAPDWATARISAREAGWGEILQRAQMLPMLSPRQALIVEDASSLERLGDKARDAILDMLEEYLDSPAPFSILIVEADSLDARQKVSKVLTAKALCVNLTLDEKAAAPLAQQMARDLGADLDAKAAALLAEILNSEPARMRIELEKLATYVGTAKKITAEDVRQMVVSARKSTIWQMAEMLANGNRKAAFAFLDNLLREGDEPVAMIGALVWMYRKLIEASELPAHTSGFQAARELGMRSEMAETAVRQSHRIPRQDLLGGLRALAEADSSLKSRNASPRASLEFLIARLTARPLPPIPAPGAAEAPGRRY